MLPLVVGREVEEGFRSYLTFGFESSNPYLLASSGCSPPSAQTSISMGSWKAKDKT